MAATAASPPLQPFDIRTVAACPIRLGRSVEYASASDRFTGVQYNHKPVISDAKHSTTSINRPDSGGKHHTLTLKDGRDEYLYRGSRSNGEDTYALLPDGDGDGFVLERLESLYHFNLDKAPWESSARILAERYPRLRPASNHNEDDGEDSGGEGQQDSSQDIEADADNPFDFRNHLQPTTDSPSPQFHSSRPNTLGTPSSVASQAPTRTNTPLARSVSKQPSAFALQEKRLKAKAKPKPRPADKVDPPKRVKLSPEADQSKRSENIPTVRLDRRASTRPGPAVSKKYTEQRHKRNDTDELSLDFDDSNKDKKSRITNTNKNNHRNYDDDDDGDDDGDLILDGDAPPSSRHQGQRSLGAALAGTLGAGRGPRSLLSAASSPASYVNSPLQASHHADTDAEDMDIDMGRDGAHSAEDDDGSLVLEGEKSDDNEDNDNDDDDQNDRRRAGSDMDADEDVEEIHLPSPAQVHRPSISNALVTADDDYDLENQMLLALGGEDDDMAGGLDQPADVESEEESEEE